MVDTDDEEFSVNIQQIFGASSESEEENLPSNQSFSTRRDIWYPQAIQLLITTRLSMETDFIQGKKNKNTLWNKCLLQMKKNLPDLKISALDARKKFSNLVVTFNRIKKRKEKSGRGGIFWKYFEEFNSVYGVRHNIVPPKGLIFDSLNETNYLEQNVENEINVEISNESTSRMPRKVKKDKNAELLEYLKKEDEKDNIRHQEMMAMEKEKNEIEREKVNCLKDMLAIINK